MICRFKGNSIIRSESDKCINSHSRDRWVVGRERRDKEWLNIRFAGTVVCMSLCVYVQIVAPDCGMVQLSNGTVGAQLPRDDLCECNRAGWELRDKTATWLESCASERYNLALAVKHELSGMRN